MIDQPFSSIEGDVHALFDSEWSVIKIDEHRYYRSVSGRGLKAVDYMALHPIMGLVLIELKDYSRLSAQPPADIDHLMYRKQEDSLRLIRIVRKYLKRQPLYRLLSWCRWESMMNPEWRIWRDAAACVDKGRYFFLAVIDT